MSFDTTEKVRRAMLGNDDGPLEREALIAKYNSEVYNTAEMMALFTVHSFLAPFCMVTRKADGMKGSLKFQHSPRYYFLFVPDTKGK